MRSELKSLSFAAFSGLLFGVGLAISGMSDPQKVLGFLDVLGGWDPSLALVMAAGLLVSAFGVWWAKQRGTALCGSLQIPTARNIDRDLLLGSALFGIGWGIAGYCPGPAIAGLAQGNLEVLWFLPAMGVGFWIGEKIATGRTAHR